MKSIKKLMPIMLLLIVGSCDDTPPSTNIVDGWTAFQAGNYPAAHQFFVAGTADDPLEGVIGLGWTTMRMTDSLQASHAYFASVAGDSAVHGYAGWTLASWALGNHAASISYGDFVLRRLPAFVFEFDTRVVANTMVLAQAYGYYHLANFTACLNKIKTIDPAFPNTTDPAALLTKLDALNAEQ